MSLTITTVQTARARVAGVYPTMAEIRALVAECDAKGVPDSATVQVDQSSAVSVVSASLVVTWTSAVAS